MTRLKPMLQFNRKISYTTFLLIILTTVTTVSTSMGSEYSNYISASGTVNSWPRVDITVDASKIIGINNLSLGFQLDWERWKTFLDSPVQQQLAMDASFRLVRVFDFRSTTPKLMPCTYWNESTKTGTWNWANVDALTRKIFEVGAEPLFCLGWARDNVQNYIPLGMSVNPITLLPYPESYAAYAAEWVKHFNQIGLPVRFYQIMNEPFFYFGWNAGNITRLGYFAEFWNVVARAMRRENPRIMLSHDSITQKKVFDYWLINGDDVDFLDFHKYDADYIGQYSDAEMFRFAEVRGFEDVSWSTLYSINTARQKWLNSRGKLLPAVISESNFNSAWETGTDPKIQQMAGAVWLALILRSGIFKGLNYYVYFEFSSSKSWQEAHGTGWGFGMINKDDNQPWYPFHVSKMVGSALKVGDLLVEVTSSSEDVRCVAWVHGGLLNVLLISKVYEPRTILLKGASGSLGISWIDSAVSYETPQIQTNTYSSVVAFNIGGYAVALLKVNSF